MKKLTLIFAFILIGCSSAEPYKIPLKPDQRLTPGDVCETFYPDFKEFRYADRMPYCRRNVSRLLRDRVYGDYKIPESERINYTIDHKIPLSLGGSNHIHNLWPQHRNFYTGEIEQKVYLQVKNGSMSVFEARRLIIGLKDKVQVLEN